MIHYTLQIIAFQLLFIVVYDLFLKRETFFYANRFYLLLTTLLSFIVPLVKIDALRASIPQRFIIQLPAVLIGKDSLGTGVNASESFADAVIIPGQGMPWISVITMIWCFGMCIAALLFCYKLYQLNKLKHSGREVSFNDLKLIILPNTNAAFSFLNTVFLGEELSEEQQENILLHEKVHISEKHSLDLLFFELIRIVCWFNPLVYIFQNRMVTLHEFTADAQVAALKSKQDYYHDLMSQLFRTEHISFVNTFFKESLIKKRIIMLQKSKSKKIFQLKYLLLIPVVCAMLFYTSCSNDQKPEAQQISAEGDTEVMQKINELAEAIMKKGNLTDEEMKALKFLTTEAKPGDKVYESVQQYLDETENDVPFAKLDKAPIYPGCEGTDNDAAKKCMAQKIQTFIIENFDTKVGEKENVEGRQRIVVKFKIDQSGKVTNVSAKADHDVLVTEAIRVVSQLPQMQPGEHKGKTVNVLYALPIVFAIE